MILLLRMLSLLVLATLVASCNNAQESASEAEIRAEVARMASDFLSLRQMKGFPYDMPLAEAVESSHMGDFRPPSTQALGDWLGLLSDPNAMTSGAMG